MTLRVLSKSKMDQREAMLLLGSLNLQRPQVRTPEYIRT